MDTIFLLLSQIQILETTLYEFEGVYDPTYLNLDPEDPNAWKVYAEKVRTLMAKAL